ncbi:hypothetical protein EW026_g7531 [Hermanssonia centrifuga]|uniref:Uncharacterized protein n=1 Tax=Hermanssonia centrifuga TaxID=98765 RepID=A0A4S4K9A8_9APHY|nr:hypothetical protein EW026_g7531 [Hermanssonia centrifuga]
MADWPEDNCAVGADGKLKDASEMDWAFSESEEQPSSSAPRRPKSPVLAALHPSRLKKPTWKAAEADPLVPRASVSSAIKHFFAPNKSKQSNAGPAQASSTSIATPKPTVKKRSILGKKKSNLPVTT